MTKTLTWDAIEDMAKEAGHRPDTIRKWKEARRRVPYKLRGEFMARAARRGLKLRFEDFDSLALELRDEPRQRVHDAVDLRMPSVGDEREPVQEHAAKLLIRFACSSLRGRCDTVATVA